ncbi:AAA-12 domain-containing protein [Mycena kentingensis (nom. inval.)]|nr:AAA-12 domain-containing protein [Mycena kentingensis (nom. inval.)]
MSDSSLSATKLAHHFTVHCDLYLHNAYNRRGSATIDDPSAYVQAHFQRGLDWERACLFPFLDRENLLLTIPPRPIDSATLSANLEADERHRFFVSGLEFWPPKEIEERFRAVGSEVVAFGLAKPDLLEITRSEGKILWRVVDAKASKTVKVIFSFSVEAGILRYRVQTSHHVQIYFYQLCLSYLLPQPLFQPADNAAIWLPPAGGFDADTVPSLDDLKSINIHLLAPSLDDFLFRRLPKIVLRPKGELQWHLNPLCRACPYEEECTEKTVAEGRLGTMPNISLAQVEILRTVLGISRLPKTTDIEDLHLLIGNAGKMASLQASHPSTMKKAKRILAMRRSATKSPVLDAARSKKVQLIPRRNFTLPRREDVSIIISIVDDPSSPKQRIASFCISVFSCIPTLIWEPICGSADDFIPSLSHLLDDVLSLNEYVKPPPLTQIYVFSSNEDAAIKAHLVETALTTSSVSIEELRLCIGSIVDGAVLLQTNFQPLVLSGALLSFNRSQFRKSAIQTLLQRINLSTDGTVEDLRARLEAKVHELQNQNGKNEMGQLPRVVVLKKEIESLLALPVPGSWDLVECARTLLPAGSCDRRCPSDEEIFELYRKDTRGDALQERLEQRNASIYAVLQATRQRISGSSTTILVNDGKPLCANWLDLCHEPSLRKLFFMQQFEVLAKLSELWKARIEGCPDAPVLEYKETFNNHHIFYLVSGSIDMPGGSKERSFYDFLLGEDENDPTAIPPEAFFDDLSVSGQLFPLNRNTKGKWDAQNAVVHQKLCIADIRDVVIERNRTRVTLQTWGRSSAILRPGTHYRLSPRLVDFNTSKVLSTLLELDIKASAEAGNIPNIPFLQLVVNPRSFADDTAFRAKGKELVRAEGAIQSMFRALKDLDGLEKPAGELMPKPSQHRAVQRILSSRLSVLWGPPGTGKTYTLALALLRLLESQHRLGIMKQNIIFITAMTHAAIDAVNKKLVQLLERYQSIPSLPIDWLKKVRIERVLKGNEHASPAKADSSSSILYLGTLYNFSKRYSFEVDVCVIDEAGQLALSYASLVLRNLHPKGRIVISGDSEQLAPILTAAYPRNRLLFGSILDALMVLSKLPAPSLDMLTNDWDPPASPTTSDYSASQDTVVQLTESFRLNPDLGEFVSTIYSRAFKPQKVQARQLATQLKSLADDSDDDGSLRSRAEREVRRYLLALSAVMLRKPQNVLSPPPLQTPNAPAELGAPRAISLALLRLQTESTRPEGVGYEAHVRGEAELAAALVNALRRCCPHEDIFVAAPHRVQRQAVKDALRKSRNLDDLVGQMQGLGLGDESMAVDESGMVTVDTVERLQGSEAGFVICLFSLPPSATPDLGFLLERRRLNVAISRAKTLCVLVTSSVVLRPPVSVLANEETAKGYAFLRAFEDRAWSSTISMSVDAF